MTRGSLAPAPKQAPKAVHRMATHDAAPHPNPAPTPQAPPVAAAFRHSGEAALCINRDRDETRTQRDFRTGRTHRPVFSPRTRRKPHRSELLSGACRWRRNCPKRLTSRIASFGFGSPIAGGRIEWASSEAGAMVLRTQAAVWAVFRAVIRAQAGVANTRRRPRLCAFRSTDLRYGLLPHLDGAEPIAGDWDFLDAQPSFSPEGHFHRLCRTLPPIACSSRFCPAARKPAKPIVSASLLHEIAHAGHCGAGLCRSDPAAIVWPGSQRIPCRSQPPLRQMRHGSSRAFDETRPAGLA